MTRYYSGTADTQGQIVSVFGWYGAPEWVKVRLVKKLANGEWLVERLK